MEVLLLISLIGTIILVGFLGNVLFNKTNIPNTLWLLLFGLILGSSGLFDKTALFSLAELIGAIAIITILSDGGLKLHIDTLFAQAKKGILLMLLGVVSSIIVATLVMKFFGFSTELGILLGLIIAGTSSSVVIPTITKMKGIKEETKSLLSFESISDTFSIVIALILINLIAIKELNFKFVNVLALEQSTIGPSFNVIFNSFLSAIAIGIIAGLLLAPLVYRAKKMEFHYSLIIGLLFLIYAFAESISSSGAITVFVTGIMMANSEKILKTIIPDKNIVWLQDVSQTHSLISFLIRSFFFVFLGAIVSISDFGALIIGITIALLVFSARIGYVKLLAAKQKLPAFDRHVMSVMVPRGLSAAVLATIPFSKGIIEAQLFVDIVFTIIIASIVISTIGITLAQRELKKQDTSKPQKTKEAALVELKLEEPKKEQKIEEKQQKAEA